MGALISLQRIEACAFRVGVILGEVELLILHTAGNSVRFDGARVAIASREVPGDERLLVQNNPAGIEDFSVGELRTNTRDVLHVRVRSRHVPCAIERVACADRPNAAVLAPTGTR